MSISDFSGWVPNRIFCHWVPNRKKPEKAPHGGLAFGGMRGYYFGVRRRQKGYTVRISAGSVFALVPLAIALTGCPAPIEGIRFLAHTPPIDVAYRKLTVALTADDYQITGTTPGLHRAETGWREAKEKK